MIRPVENLSPGMQAEVAVLRKQKQLTEQQGQQAMQLIDSVPKPAEQHLGRNVNIRA